MPSAGERLNINIDFVNTRYEVKLPFKDCIPCVKGNVQLRLSRLNKWKNKLSWKDELLLENCITKTIDNTVIPVVVIYLTHQNLICELN